jgi:ferredoxin-thioredoxin reductase catalytic subunit
MSSSSQEPISHDSEWSTLHSLHLGDAHRGEALGRPRRSPIRVATNHNHLFRQYYISEYMNCYCLLYVIYHNSL